MPVRAMSNSFLVLRLEPSGESFLKLHLLGADEGLQLCLKRVSRKNAPGKPAPDLFDTADVSLELSKHGTMRFVSDYHILERRRAIGNSYQRLRRCSDFCNLLVLNSVHMPDLTTLYQLAARSLDAFNRGGSPEVIYLKSLYLLLRDEGYPVRESWWQGLPPALRHGTGNLLSQKVPDTLEADQNEGCLKAISQLEQWLRRETELILPGT